MGEGRGTEQDGTVCTTTAASTLYTVLYNPEMSKL